jgi:serine protease Do
LNVKLAEVEPKATANNAPGGAEPNAASGLLSGVRVENLAPDSIRAMKLPENTRGVLVVEVDPESNAALSGLRRGTVIEEVAKQPVTNVNEFNAALQKLGDRKSALLRVRDANGGRFLIVQAQE